MAKNPKTKPKRIVIKIDDRRHYELMRAFVRGEPYPQPKKEEANAKRELSTRSS